MPSARLRPGYDDVSYAAKRRTLTPAASHTTNPAAIKLMRSAVLSRYSLYWASKNLIVASCRPIRRMEYVLVSNRYFPDFRLLVKEYAGNGTEVPCTLG